MIYPQDYIFFHELNMSYEERKKRFMKNVSKLENPVTIAMPL